MKTEQEIRKQLEEVTMNYYHVLDCYPATIEINAARALMQIQAIAIINTLYQVLGEKRPIFKCDDFTKLDH